MRNWVFWALMAAAPAWADWSFIAKSDSFSLYGESNSKQRNGNLVRMWSMADYQATQSIRLPPPLLWTNYQSMRELKEFDCASRQHRSIKTILFSARLAKGEAIYTFDSAGAFAPVAAAPLDAAQFQFACK